jgi:hypothetical protein
MRYHVTYLAEGKRSSLIVQAPSAAAAVSATSDRVGNGPTAFELLSVRLAADASARATTGDRAT